MDFQREMSSTSYQRGTADMKAAGLNPMLGYAQGGASTPGGASASMESDLGEGANSAMSAAMTITQMKSALAGIERTNAETDVAESQAGLLNAQKLTELNRPENVRASTESLRTGRDKSEAELRGILLRNTLLNETMEDQKYEIASAARLRGHQAESTRLGLSEDRAKSNFWESAVGKASPYINLGTETANSAIGAIGKAMRLGKFGF